MPPGKVTVLEWRARETRSESWCGMGVKKVPRKFLPDLLRFVCVD